MLALLYSVLTDRAKAESVGYFSNLDKVRVFASNLRFISKHFELLRVSNRDNYATIMRQLDHFIEFAYFPRLKNDVRRQV